MIRLERVRYKNFDQASFADFEVFGAIPPHPFWDLVNQHIDFSFADKLCEPLYSPLGQRPYAPSLKLKIHLVQRYYNVSDREMEMKIVGDIFVKRFLGVPISLAKFDHSTIALDRSRLGAEMFHACHVYILAQALSLGLWGQEDDRWLVDSFHTEANVSRPSTYELIQQATCKLIQHLKKKNSAMYEELKQHMDVGFFFQRLKRDAEPMRHKLALSNLAVQAYGLVAWMQSKGGFTWENERERAVSIENWERLLRILRENLTNSGGDGEDSLRSRHSKDAGVQETNDSSAVYVEMKNDEKPSNRVVNAHDPDVRVGYKSTKKSFVGDKIQVVESAQSQLILNAEPIAGNEADGEALPILVEGMIEEFGLRPAEVIADSAYGSGANRQQLKNLGTLLTAPLPNYANPAGSLLKNDQFTYVPEQDHVVCPGGHISVRKAHIKASQGTQYHFKAETCRDCPLRAQCTNSKFGRAVFVNDHWELIRDAKAYNVSENGKEAMKARYEIERTNNEMKRHHGLGRPRTRGRKALRIDAKITAMVVNLKRIVKSLANPRGAVEAPVCLHG